MTPIEADLMGMVLQPDGQLLPGCLSMSRGQIVTEPVGCRINLDGFLILPGIVDVHGDAFERHVAPRRGAMKDVPAGLRAVAAEVAANGITTAVLAQFWSWEGGLRGPDFARTLFAALAQVQPHVAVDLLGQMRFETHMLEDYEMLPVMLQDWAVRYLVFNDHLPHARLAEGRLPKRLTGQALKAARSPEAHLARMRALHARAGDVPEAVTRLCRLLAERGVRMGSHDDKTARDRQVWQERGVTISEFPETLEAAAEARAGGASVIMGAPNVVRGGSHNGNLSALDLIAMGGVDALASDYHYPSMRAAIRLITASGLLSLGSAWALVSSGPAGILGLKERGVFKPGARADVVVLDPDLQTVGATIAGGVVAQLSGEVAHRFVAASHGR